MQQMSSPSAARPVLIGIDGRSGSGKSTLAAALLARLSPHAHVCVLPLESLYPGWDGLAVPLGDHGAYPRALRELTAGRPARWRAWDWHVGTPGPWQTTPVCDVVVCEGVGALCRSARPLLDLTVWLDGDEAERRRRALARDGDLYAPHWRRWAAQEERYLAEHAPRAAADLRLRLE